MMQQQMMQMQQEIASLEAIGDAGNGLVMVKINGDYEMLRCTIQPDCVDPEDVEGLEDLVKSAYNNAVKKLQDEMSAKGSLGSFGF